MEFGPAWSEILEMLCEQCWKRLSECYNKWNLLTHEKFWKYPDENKMPIFWSACGSFQQVIMLYGILTVYYLIHLFKKAESVNDRQTIRHRDLITTALYPADKAAYLQELCIQFWSKPKWAPPRTPEGRNLPINFLRTFYNCHPLTYPQSHKLFYSSHLCGPFT